MKIYDTFMYSGEDDLLEIRLNELDAIVDKFIILESSVSHTKKFKNLDFLKTRSQFERFERFLPKIDYYNVDYCIHDNPFFNDFNGRQTLSNILQTRYFLDSKDIILHGDLDEIPNVSVLNGFLGRRCKQTMEMKKRILCLDLEEENGMHYGTMILDINDIRNNALFDLRNKRHGCDDILFCSIRNCGWHFTYCLGVQNTLKKLDYFAHAKECPDHVKSEQFIVSCVKNNETLTGHKLIKKNLNAQNFPNVIIENVYKYKKILSDFYGGNI